MVDGLRVHYLDSGEGAPVVLLHGNLLRAEDFVCSGLMASLSKHHRVIAIDRPGFGYSERPRGRAWTAEAQAAHIQRVLEALQVRQPTVVGHSWGALVALELALHPAAEVVRLILVSGYYFPTLRLDTLLAAPSAIPMLGAVLQYTFSALAARLLLNTKVKRMFAPRRVPPGFLAMLDREMLLRPKQIRAGSQDGVTMIRAAARLDQRYAGITAPLILFAGEDDRVVNVRQARRLNKVIPGSELICVPGAGHMAHYAACREIAAAVGTPKRTRSPRFEDQPIGQSGLDGTQTATR